jgi:hypothetical protein
MEDASEDMLQRYKEKQVDLYERIERELKEVQQDVRLVYAVPVMPSSSQTLELGNELAQLRRIVYATEYWFQRDREEKEKATKSLQKEKYEVLVQLREAQDSVASYESEKEEL